MSRCLALLLGRILLDFVEPRNLGLVSGADGSVRLFPGLVRVPDVALRLGTASRSQDPQGADPILVPDLVIEVLSESNTKAEMERKRGEYFSSGVRLIWEIDPVPRHRHGLHARRTSHRARIPRKLSTVATCSLVLVCSSANSSRSSTSMVDSSIPGIDLFVG